MKIHSESYHLAQRAMSELKAAVHFVLANAPDGLTKLRLGGLLESMAGHVGHEGHSSRTLLALLESEGVTEQDPATKRWRLKDHSQKTDED